MPKLFNCVPQLFIFFSGYRQPGCGSAALAGSSQAASDYNDGDNHWIALSAGDKQNDQQKTNIDFARLQSSLENETIWLIGWQ